MTKRLLIILILLISSSASAEMLPVNKQRVGTPPHLVLKTILQVNNGNAVSLPPASANQAPYLTWLADSDGRIDPNLILPSSSGLLYSVRNIANQFSTAVASIDYGILILHSPVLLITGNTDNLAISHVKQELSSLPSAIRGELDHLLLPLQTLPAEPDNALLQNLELVERGVDFQVRLAMERYSNRIRDDRLVVVGAVLDLANTYGQGANQLRIININGVQEKEKILKMAVAKNLPPALSQQIGRIRPH